MNDTQQAFMTLLKAGLWGEIPVAGEFSLTERMWKQIYLSARKQTVQGIVFDGLMLLPADNLPPKDLLIKWTVEVDSIERANKRMNRVVGELAAFFAENGIMAVLLKGQGIMGYRTQCHRVPGDADWCFPLQRDWKRANRLIAEKGIAMRQQAGFSMTYQWKECVVEHHKRILDVHNPWLDSYVQRLTGDELDGCQRLVTDAGVVRILSPLLVHLSVTIHILKHMLAFGVGMRQLCDVACIYQYYYGEIDGAKLEQVYRKIGMYRWVQELNAVLVRHLGLPERYLPFPLSGKEKADWLMEDIFQAGNFGFHDDRYGKRDNGSGRRPNAFCHLLRRFRMNVGYAPAEACWFPVVQAYSRIRNYF